MAIERFWDLLSKKDCGSATEAELKELEGILLAHPEYGNTAEILSVLNLQSGNFESDAETEQAFDLHVRRMKNADVPFEELTGVYSEPAPVEKTSRRKWWLPAGIAAVIVLSFFILKNNLFSETGTSQRSTLSRVITKPGSKSQIQLPDGSTVWLNASSTLTYDKNFGKTIREVNLIGEAFFNVTKDSSHPFIIHTNVIDVKVLGTSFNVKSYPNEANTETSLIRGKVEVTVKNRFNEKIYLEPNEKLVVANGVAENHIPGHKPAEKETESLAKPLYSVQHLNYYPVDSAIIETSWVDNRLLFQSEETFSEVALKMERRYGVQISFASEKVAMYHPFGSFRNESISQALDALRLGLKFNYKMEGNKITITQ